MKNRANSEKFLRDIDAEVIGDVDIDYGIVLESVFYDPNTRESEFKFSAPRNPKKVSVNGVIYYHEMPSAGTPGPMETAPMDGTDILIHIGEVWLQGCWMVYPDSKRKPRWLIFGYPHNAFTSAGESPEKFRRWMPKP